MDTKLWFVQAISFQVLLAIYVGGNWVTNLGMNYSHLKSRKHHKYKYRHPDLPDRLKLCIHKNIVIHLD